MSAIDMRDKGYLIFIKLLVISFFIISFEKLESTIDPGINDGMLYYLDLSNPSSYKVSCYDNISSKWRVKNELCTLETNSIIIPGEINEVLLDIPLNINLKAFGNISEEDYVLIKYFHKNTWSIIDSISARLISENYNVFPYLIRNIGSGEKIKISVAINSTSENCEISVKSTNRKDFCIGSPFISETNQLYVWNRKPVIIESYSVNKSANSLNLEWISKYEFNNRYFIIEKSANGFDFEFLTKIDGKKYSNTLVNYNFSIKNKFDNTKYYKLKYEAYNEKTTDLCLFTIYSDSVVESKSINHNPCLGKCEVYVSSGNDSLKKMYFKTFDILGNNSKIYIDEEKLKRNFNIVYDSENYMNPGLFIIKEKTLNKNKKL